MFICLSPSLTNQPSSNTSSSSSLLDYLPFHPPSLLLSLQASFSPSSSSYQPSSIISSSSSSSLLVSLPLCSLSKPPPSAPPILPLPPPFIRFVYLPVHNPTNFLHLLTPTIRLSVCLPVQPSYNPISLYTLRSSTLSFRSLSHSSPPTSFSHHPNLLLPAGPGDELRGCRRSGERWPGCCEGPAGSRHHQGTPTAQQVSAAHGQTRLHHCAGPCCPHSQGEKLIDS